MLIRSFFGFLRIFLFIKWKFSKTMHDDMKWTFLILDFQFVTEAFFSSLSSLSAIKPSFCCTVLHNRPLHWCFASLHPMAEGKIYLQRYTRVDAKWLGHKGCFMGHEDGINAMEIMWFYCNEGLPESESFRCLIENLGENICRQSCLARSKPEPGKVFRNFSVFI